MSSKVIGVMLVLGPILIMGPWMFLGLDASDMPPSEKLNALIAESNKVELRSILNVFGAMAMFTGLYLLARSLRSDKPVSNTCAEIGGLFLLLCVPLWVVLLASDISAIEAAEEFGNDVGASILAASTLFQMVGILMVVGVLLLGIALTLLRKYKGIIGALFVVAAGLAFVDMLAQPESEFIATLGWMGIFFTTLVTGVLTTLQKETTA